MRHPLFGRPRELIAAALAALGDAGLEVEAVSPVVTSDPLGPSRRRYANAAAIVTVDLSPEAVLDRLQEIERSFGRRRRGGRWRARVLDLDIVLWSGGAWASPRLILPHRHMRERDFVLGPAVTIAPEWRDPLSGLAIRQLHARLTRAAPLP